MPNSRNVNNEAAAVRDNRERRGPWASGNEFKAKNVNVLCGPSVSLAGQVLSKSPGPPPLHRWGG